MYTGGSTIDDKLWRFDTFKRVWEAVDVDVRPSARSSHVMASVRQDLWLNSGEGEGDAFSTRTSLMLLR
jgi:hypothetical protein